MGNQLYSDTNLFQNYLNGIIHDGLKTLTALGYTLVPIFFLLDFFTMPKELLPRFGIYRLTSTLIILAQYFVIRYTKPSNFSYYHGYFVSLNVGGIIALMTVDLGGFNSSYYAGLNLVIIAVNLLLSWEAIHSAVNSIIIISMYVIFNTIAAKEFIATSLINNLFFLCSTAIIAGSINHVKHKLVKQEFSLRIELRKARDALWSEMELAKRIQTALLPDNEKMCGFEIAATMSPAEEVGGDYYDIIQTPKGDKWITIGDVSGHGVDSGLIMMMAQTSTLSILNDGNHCKPSDVLSSVNAVIRENISRMGSDHYMAMTAICFNDSQMIIAGKHQDIIIYRASSNRTEIVPTKGTWLGITDDIRNYLVDVSATLEVGDIVLLFTDGITEATNLNGEMFGQKRLEHAINQYADLQVAKIVEKIIKDVINFQEKQLDDITLLAIKKISRA
ncbi:MAG: SpoIIE family protein phosphatase [Desulfobacterales bacterium]